MSASSLQAHLDHGDRAGSCDAAAPEGADGEDPRVTGPVKVDAADSVVTGPYVNFGRHASAGDSNGDGLADILVGAPWEWAYGPGSAYLYEGPHAESVPASDRTAHILGPSGCSSGNCAWFGFRVDLGGDLDGDGLDDPLAGGLGYDNFQGRAWGFSSPVAGELDVSQADTSFESGESYSGFGIALSSSGDLDGDGAQDVVIGSAGRNDGSTFDVGSAFAWYGPFEGSYDSDGADGVVVGIEAYDRVGVSTLSSQDWDGDGMDDLLVGAEGVGDDDRGAVYLFAGPVLGTMTLDDATVSLAGDPKRPYAGTAASSAGDVDGDGHADLVIGGSAVYHATWNAGSAWLVLGPLDHPRPLSSAEATLDGEADGDLAGAAVSGAGDLDADGLDDLLIGAPGNDAGGSTAGVAYLLYGPVEGQIGLAGADARFEGTAGKQGVGAWVGTLGDRDGDGDDDVALGGMVYGRIWIFDGI